MIIALLGGAGFMGAGIVRDLVSDRAIVDLDVTDAAALAAAISGADICINCVPTLLGFRMAIFEDALTLKRSTSPSAAAARIASSAPYASTSRSHRIRYMPLMSTRALR